MLKKKDIIGLYTLMFLLLLTHLAVARDNSMVYQEHMVVTAQKQEQNVQDVPISVSVFSSQNIEDSNVESLSELVDYVPNLTLINNGRTGLNSPSMRGIHVLPHSYTTSIGLFIDGVPALIGNGFDDQLLEVERVEVLRGPQGTLYGKNTESGAISIVTRQPDNQFMVKLSADGDMLLSRESGNGLGGTFSLQMSGPVMKDRLYFSLAGQYKRQDGYIENTLTGDVDDDREQWFGRGEIRWTPMDRLDLSLTISRQQSDDGASNMNMGENGAAAFGLPVPQDRKVSSNFRGEDTSSVDIQALKATYELVDMLSLTSVSARRMVNFKNRGDWDFSPYTLSHTKTDADYEKLSQELRLDYAGQGLKWLIGLYGDIDDNNMHYDTMSDYPSMAGVTNKEIKGKSWAVFANATYPLFRGLSLVGGLRYERQDMEFTNHVSGLNADDDWGAISPRVGLEYKFTPEVMAFFTLSKGYRSGGFNMFTSSATSEYITYDDEELWNYELGLKSTFFDNRLVFNGSVFYMTINDMQVDEAVTPMESYITNAAEASGMGVELEMTARLTDTVSLSASFGWVDIEFDEFKDALGDYEGNKNTYAPEYSFNVGAQYRHPVGFYARADLVGYGRMFFDKANLYKRDPYQLVNARIGYESEHFDFYLYGKNIFDERYDSEGYYDGMYTIYSDPGQVGLQVVCRF